MVDHTTTKGDQIQEPLIHGDSEELEGGYTLNKL